MPVAKVKTYYLLDLWSRAPEAEGFAYVVRMLHLRGVYTNHKAVKSVVWEALVAVGLLDPGKKATPKDWKRAKNEWRTNHQGSLME